MKPVSVGNDVRLARLTAGLTQQELGDRVGVTRQTIGLIESDCYNPSIRLCLMLAKETGRTLNDLFWIGDDGGDEP